MEVAGNLTNTCQICGQPVTVLYQPTGLHKIDYNLRKMASMVVHDHCYGQRIQEQTQEEELARLVKRGNDFAELCPAQYRDSDEWLKTGHAKKVNLKAVHEALAWPYGKTGLIMHGKTSGSGKTTAAWVLCKREILLGRFVVALTHKELSDKATWAAKELNATSKQWARIVKTCDLLFIDDLGKSRFRSMSGEGRASEEFLFDVMDKRCSEGLPILFTVNMTGTELKAAMSEDKGAYFSRRMREFFKSISFDK